MTLLVFSASAQWVGVPRDDSFSLAGLIPFSDALAHYSNGHDAAKNGVWTSFAARRPIATAIRSSTMLVAWYSYPALVLLQVFALAGAICFAATAVARWRGLWAGLAFAAIMMIWARTYTTTSLTEPLGLFIALLAVPFFIDALRGRSLNAGLIAFALTCIALLTRMGAMFTIPVLFLWLVWQFGFDLRSRLAVTAKAMAILVAIMATNFILQKAYTSGDDYLGGNFSHTLCGLSIGTTREGCQKRYKSEFAVVQQDERALVEALLTRLGKTSKPTRQLSHLA